MFKKLFDTKKKMKEFKSHCRPEILSMVKSGRTITKDNIPEGMNSYEAQLLMPLWDDELLLEKVKHYIGHAGCEFYKTPEWKLPDHYNDAIKTKFIFMLIERFEQLIIKKGD